MSDPLSVGDVVRVDKTETTWIMSPAGLTNHTFPTPITTTYPNANPQYTYTTVNTTLTNSVAAKQPPLGALLIITGLLRNEQYPMEAKDIENGEEFEVYRYQVSLDPFLTAAHRRRAAKEVEIESQIETNEPLLLEAAK